MVHARPPAENHPRRNALVRRARPADLLRGLPHWQTATLTLIVQYKATAHFIALSELTYGRLISEWVLGATASLHLSCNAPAVCVDRQGFFYARYTGSRMLLIVALAIVWNVMDGR